jgi:outer membrane receptor protein involved in Fe transport
MKNLLSVIRLCLCCVAWFVGSFASAQTVSDNGTQSPTRLREIVVTERADSLVGVAQSGSEGVVGARQLRLRPLLRPGELLETVPGVIITQHSGAGKANQFFLRGFNLDHGTDFATSLDGVPVNLPTHAHGQGYTDLNFLIPELVQTLEFRKGPYFADTGDFSSTGAANFRYARSLPQGIAHIEGGEFNYWRGLFAASPRLGNGTLLYAVELLHNDGPWSRDENFRKTNAVLRYTHGDDERGWAATAMAYRGEWDATDQIPKRAVDSGMIGRFDSLDTTNGGDSQRYALSWEAWRRGEQSRTRLLLYGFYYDLDLFSNFTYFLDDPVNGDQFEQSDKRWVFGAQASHEWDGKFAERDMENAVGVQVRSDIINNGLFHTAARQRLATTRKDYADQTSVGAFWQNRIAWSEKFRTVAGARGDLFHFNVNSNNAANTGARTDAIASPKLSLIFGPWAQTEFYINAGLGFHSNDARGVNTTIDPASGLPVDKADPLVRTMGAEIGARSLLIPNLQSTVALWWLDIDSELVFVGDAGATAASRPSRRYGVEWANYYTPTKWLTIDADLSLSHSRFRDFDPAGDRIPGSIECVLAAGVSVHNLGGLFGSARVRYFGARPLIEDDSARSSSTTLVNLRVGYEFNKHIQIALEVFNVFDAKSSDIDYFYTSRLPGEPAAGVDDVHFHPAEPRMVRAAVTVRF